MAQLKKNWHWIGGVLLLCVVLAGTWRWRSAEARSAMLMIDGEGPGAPGYQALSPVIHDAITTLLADISLDRDALIALNPSANVAESILSTTRTWQASNASTVASSNLTIAQKTYAVRQIEKAIAMGPYDENRAAALATARQELADAKAAYRTTLSSLESSISNLLSESQRSTWTAIKTGWGQQMPIRMLNLSDDQRMAVSDAKQRYERKSAAANNDEERAAAQTTYQNALDAILTGDQKNAMTSFTTNYSSASSAVNGAFDTVLHVQQG